jgi:hypothetical protein
MLGRDPLRLTARVGALALASLVVASPAYAATGLYAGLSLGYGTLSGTELIVSDLGGDRPNTDPATCCADGGMSTEFRLGYGILGVVAPEFYFGAHAFGFGTKVGGAGFLGGGLRLFPLGLLDTLGLSTKDIPIDLGIGAVLGYTVTGRDFAYHGMFFGLDFTAEYLVSDVFSLGARFSWIKPTFNAWAYTDYNNSLGRCLDDNAAQDPTTTPIARTSASCSGRGPNTSYISPQLTATFHFDI